MTFTVSTLYRTATWALAATAVACGSAASPASSPPALRIVATSGAPLEAVAGDAIPLTVVEVSEDGGLRPLPEEATVTWESPARIAVLPPGSPSANPIPAFGLQPTAAWIDNPYRPDRNENMKNVLFVLDPGVVQNATVPLKATVSGVASAGTVTASVIVDPTPLGDPARGSALYGSGGANCASCHGATGSGTLLVPGVTTYSYASGPSDVPSPGLNAEPGNAAGDPAWNAALFAVAARADMDNAGVALRLPMPDWLDGADPSTGHPLATQDFADIVAFLKTQTH